MQPTFRAAVLALALLSSAGAASPPVAQLEMEGRVTHVSELPGFGCGIFLFWGKVTLADSNGEARDAYILCMGEGKEPVPRLGQYCVAKYHIGDVTARSG